MAIFSFQNRVLMRIFNNLILAFFSSPFGSAGAGCWKNSFSTMNEDIRGTMKEKQCVSKAAQYQSYIPIQ
jgi:hypothetical protein